MLSQVLYQDAQVKWVVFGRDPQKPGYVIDTNEYLIIANGKGLLMDPGGTEIFPEVVAAISDHIPLENIEVIFGSHQDPDILSSLSLWLGVCPQAKVYVPWVWTGFITHFGCDKSQMIGVPDEGCDIELAGTYKVTLVPAHYLHSSGNLHLYDPHAKILFSGDVGAALLPEDANQMFVEQFDSHTKYMETFHRRWMPSNRARDVWVNHVRGLAIDMMCPQHGGIFCGDDVAKFFDWFSGLELGAALENAAPLRLKKQA